MATEQVATTQPAITPAQQAKLKDGEKGWPERSITVDYDFVCGESEDPAAAHGEKEVKHFFYKGAKVYIQSNVRRWLKVGKSDSEILELIKKLKLTITTGTRKSAAEKIGTLFSGMSKEQKVAALKQLREQAGI